jgi:heptosyltransferase I
MNAVLVIRPSSLGDVVHALALVDDVRRHRPELAVDWVAEEAFAPLVALHPGVRRVIPVALRRWRRRPLAASTWREFGAFRDELRRERYAAIVDLQEQIKGAILSRLARGPRHGPDRATLREPLAALFHQHQHRIGQGQHFEDRCRQLTGAALGYVPSGPPRYGLVAPPPPAAVQPAGRYVTLFHSTSRVDKLWPEERWRALVAALGGAGFAVLLPWGSDDERARSERLAKESPTAIVPPRLPLPALAGLIACAEGTLGVDTGLVHLAAALGTPTVALFIATDPAQAGVARSGTHALDLGGVGITPTVEAAVAAFGALLAAAPRR